MLTAALHSLLMQLDGRTIAPVLPLLTTLSVCLEMADITQFLDLLDLLRYLPNICELSLQVLSDRQSIHHAFCIVNFSRSACLLT